MCMFVLVMFSQQTRHAQRRRWPNIKTSLFQLLHAHCLFYHVYVSCFFLLMLTLWLGKPPLYLIPMFSLPTTDLRGPLNHARTCPAATRA